MVAVGVCAFGEESVMSEWKRLLVGRFTVLLALLGFNILVLPLLDEGMVGDFIGRAFYSLLFIECADLLRRTGRYFRTGLVLSALALGFGWLVPFWPGPWIYLLQFLFAGTLLFFHAIRLMDAVRKDHLGNEQSIVGALCAYLLLGLAWTMAYSMVCSADPGAFSVRIFDDADGGGVERSRHASFSQLIYFSITTITTLGYGDIVPRSPLAKSLAMCEVLTGVAFLTVVLSVLVGMLGRRDRHGHHHPVARSLEPDREQSSAPGQV